MNNDSQTATDRGYQVLKKRIVAGEFRPRERLREVDLADAVGVSRTPIREALRRLQVEGFVVIEPNRGARVAERPPGDLADSYEVRSVVEALGARKAAANPSPELIQQLSDLQDEMDRMAGETSQEAIERISVLNDSFHHLIMGASGNDRLVAARTAAVSGAVMAGTWLRFSDEDRARSFAQHRELIAALSARDPDWAASVAQAHMLAARNLFSRA